MKRITLTLAAAFVTLSGIFAQNVDDALRYSQIFYNGTARFMSMGGAFTALGGDMSTFTQNPAGIGVFRSSEISFTPQLFHIGTTSNFHGLSKDYMYNFNIGQIGIVSSLIKNTTRTTGLISLNVGYSFNKTNNLNTSIRIEGISTSNSLADAWADQGSGTYYSDLSGAPGIAYDAWIMDTITGSGATSYGTVFSNYGDSPGSTYGQTIRRIISNTGYTGEHALTIGGNFSNKFFFGATLGIDRINYTGTYDHHEQADYNLASGFQNFTYTEYFNNTGTGFTFKIGAVLKPVEAVRIGLAFHAPTYYRINEYYYDNITSNFTGNGHYEFENQPTRYSYGLTTPFRALAGIAVQIKKIALLSADYEFVDYTTTKFSQTGDNYDYTEKNLEIKNTLKPTSNIRVGGELRLNKMYLRGGYGYYGKVFKLGEINDNMDYSAISFGLGFREQNLNVDFGFSNIQNPQRYILYNTASESAIANLSTGRNNFAVTVGYKFGY